MGLVGEYPDGPAPPKVDNNNYEIPHVKFYGMVIIISTDI